MTTPKNPAAVAVGEQWRYRDGSISTVVAVENGIVRDTLTWGDGSTGGPFENTIETWLFHLSGATRLNRSERRDA